MKKCPDCKCECGDDAKFCEECGYKFPQTKQCPKCHAELKLTAKFCMECGYSFQGQQDGGGKPFLGDNNMVSGDVVGGNLDRRTYNGNVTTNNTSTTTYEYVRQMGVDFIMSKHQDDYSSERAVEFLAMMKEIILEKGRQAFPEAAVSPEQRNKRLMQRIASELNLLGVSPKAIGYRYLQDAILLAVKGEEGNLSRKVAEKNGKTTASVERAIQNAINRTWNASDPEELLLHYTARIHSERGVPTLTEFIYYYANKLRLEY